MIVERDRNMLLLAVCKELVVAFHNGERHAV